MKINRDYTKVMICGRKENLKLNTERRNPSGCEQIYIIGPVSYTHLDVYKRQDEGTVVFICKLL